MCWAGAGDLKTPRGACEGRLDREHLRRAYVSGRFVPSRARPPVLSCRERDQALYCAGVTASPLGELLPRTKIVSARPRPCTGCASPREAVPRRCGRYPRRRRAREKWAAHPRRARRAMRAIISAIFSLGLTAAVARAGGCRTPSSTAATGTGSRSASRWATGCAAGFSTTAAARWSVGAGVSTGCRARWWVVELHLGGAHRRPRFTHRTW